MKADSTLARARLRLAAAALILLAPAPAVFAQGLFGAPEAPQAEARLVGGWAEPDGGRIAALVVDLAPGWKTYWRRPGEAGIPPTFDWSGSGNLAAISVVWPAPIAFDTFDMQTLGYAGRMTLPLRITPEDPAAPVTLRLALFYGICEDICIPARADLALDIAPGAAAEGSAGIRAAMDAEPAPAPGAAARCAFGGGARLTARIALAAPPEAAPVIVAEGQEGLWLGPMEAWLEGGEIVATGEMRAESGLWIDRAALRFTLISPEGGVVVEGCAAG